MPRKVQACMSPAGPPLRCPAPPPPPPPPRLTEEWAGGGGVWQPLISALSNATPSASSNPSPRSHLPQPSHPPSGSAAQWASCSEPVAPEVRLCGCAVRPLCTNTDGRGGASHARWVGPDCACFDRTLCVLLYRSLGSEASHIVQTLPMLTRNLTVVCH